MNLERYTDDGVRVWHNASTEEVLERELAALYSNTDRIERLAQIIARLIDYHRLTPKEKLGALGCHDWHPSDIKED